MASDLKLVTPNYLLIHMHIAHMAWALLATFEAITASKQPQRSNMTPESNSVTSITYVPMSLWPLSATISRMFHGGGEIPARDQRRGARTLVKIAGELMTIRKVGS